MQSEITTKRSKYLSYEQKQEILKLYLNGHSAIYISKVFNKDPSCIHRILDKELDEEKKRIAKESRETKNFLDKYEHKIGDEKINDIKKTFEYVVSRKIDKEQFEELKNLIRETISEEIGNLWKIKTGSSTSNGS